MDLTSSALIVKGRISPRYTCDGANINPPLLISNVPEGTKSLVLIMDDPDAVIPAGKVWDHWVVFNIPPYTKEIPEGKRPKESGEKERVEISITKYRVLPTGCIATFSNCTPWIPD